ncbi:MULTISPECIES: hypothetical protein [unclassified Lacinutrix]
MSSIEHKATHKLFVIKTFQSLLQIKSVLNTIAQKKNISLQLSLLVTLSTNKTSTKKELKKILEHLKQQLRVLFGASFQFGYFHNPEIGSLCIAGHLTPTFLNKVDKTELASLPAGLLGIFRGLGMKTGDINSYLAALKNGRYCLIIRGESSVLESIKTVLSSY